MRSEKNQEGPDNGQQSCGLGMELGIDLGR